MTGTYDVSWDDPLPHALSPTKRYLSHVQAGLTKAVIIFVHGRDDNIHDMVGLFLPVLALRYGGLEALLEVEGGEEKGEEKEKAGECRVAVIGIEARDNSWYPASHNAMQEQEVANNQSYQYSSLDKIRTTILSACEAASLPPSQVVLVGFSQGANLANTYLQAGLADVASQGEKTVVPLPGHILALAGSLFKAKPGFPTRQYASAEHQHLVSEEERQCRDRLVALPCTTRVVDRLMVGTADRFFTPDEVKEAASALMQASRAVEGLVEVQVSVAIEPNAPHMITNRMMAATIEAIDAVLAS